MTLQADHDIWRKIRALEDAEQSGWTAGACQFKALPSKPKLRVAAEIEEKILHVRREFGLGQLRISWYLQRYYGLRASSSGVFGVLKRNGMSRLPRGAPKGSPSTFKCYEKQVPGHQVQIDVKFLFFADKAGRRVKRFQYTAIDDATRIRALKVYREHNQANAIAFLDYVISKFPFRIKYVHTDNGHEFQSRFHWHAEDRGIVHRYIRPASPHLNGKVERSHLTDHQEFYQLLHYTDERNLLRQLSEWEAFYNYHRPHTALKGMTPYEILKKKLAA